MTREEVEEWMRRNGVGHADWCLMIDHLEAVDARLKAFEDHALEWNPACCAREREACYQAAKATEERGWGRKGYHPVADSIRGRGEWIDYLAKRAGDARAQSGTD